MKVIILDGTLINIDNISTCKVFGINVMGFEPQGLEINGVKIYFDKDKVYEHYETIRNIMTNTAML